MRTEDDRESGMPTLTGHGFEGSIYRGAKYITTNDPLVKKAFLQYGQYVDLLIEKGILEVSDDGEVDLNNKDPKVIEHYVEYLEQFFKDVDDGHLSLIADRESGKDREYPTSGC